MPLRELTVAEYIELRSYYIQRLEELGIQDLNTENTVEKLKLLALNTELTIYNYAISNRIPFKDANDLLGNQTIEEFNKQTGKLTNVITNFTKM